MSDSIKTDTMHVRVKDFCYWDLYHYNEFSFSKYNLMNKKKIGIYNNFPGKLKLFFYSKI